MKIEYICPLITVNDILKSKRILYEYFKTGSGIRSWRKHRL